LIHVFAPLSNILKSFYVLSTYEKASGRTINVDETKGLYIGSARNRRPTFTKIKWVKRKF
jgi:hypothetical protein